MPWNRDKILAEIDRDCVPKGAESALIESPALGMEHLCFILEKDGTSRQKVNALRIVIRLLQFRAVSAEQVERAVRLIRAHTMDEDGVVGRAACRSAVLYCFFSQSYAHLRLSNSDRSALLEQACSRYPDVGSEYTAIIVAIRNSLNNDAHLD